MKTIEIELSDQAVLGLDRELGELANELRAAAAAKLYEIGRVSQEIAAEIAGMTRSDFISYLSRVRVSPMQETADEAIAGARTILGR
jgi:predicted HTH domain antitoxin